MRLDRLNPPRIFPSSLPEDEREAASFIEANLFSIAGLVREYRSSFRLFMHSAALRGQLSGALREAKEQSQFDQLSDAIEAPEDWARMAGRYGAMLAYSFAMLLQANDGLLGKCQSVKGALDTVTLDRCRELFKSTFPSIERIRLSAAHPGEIGKVPKDRDRHSSNQPINRHGLDIDNSDVLITGSINVSGDQLTYHATIKGQHVEFTLSQQTVAAFTEIVSLYFNSFEKIGRL